VTRTLITLSIIAMTLFSTRASAEPYWSAIQPGDCKCDGFRTYLGVLKGIPSGTSVTQACFNTPATINGHYFSGADRCINLFTAALGYFDLVGDASCSSTGIDPSNWNCIQDPATSDPACQICTRMLNCEVASTYHTC
jgi:hypothetical protein